MYVAEIVPCDININGEQNPVKTPPITQVEDFRHIYRRGGSFSEKADQWPSD